MPNIDIPIAGSEGLTEVMVAGGTALLMDSKLTEGDVVLPALDGGDGSYCNQRVLLAEGE
ncbi:hypothetical protein E2562_033624 [Oryza meyeriana var. granulata]|uniref:Uncharacterized protein n=1 Tax=Oryza meyeriana var. granulata TaxID=110450 RepID=A0A6G1FFC0_9ORYZ|nr:hypothetical protein E2562_033624 [Oryza meyeriana var. granulata]